MSKRVLIIAHFFPPLGTTASRRPGGMAKYLPEFGWEPLVLTRSWRPDNCNYDPSIVPGLPADLLRYEFDCPPPRGASAAFEQLVRFGRPHLHPHSFLRAARHMLATVLREQQFDVIWVTVPQANLLDVAQEASRLSGRPWVADFRDAWQFVPNWFVRLTMGMRLAYERRLVADAAAITTVSEGLAQTLEERHGRSVHTITHGFDPDLVSVDTVRRFERFNIVYTGGVTLGRPNFRPLLDAIEVLVSRGEMDANDVRVEFYGEGNSVRLAEMFAGHPRAGLVIDHGPVSHDEVTEHQRSAAVLLGAGHPGARGVITSKMFEYIVAGRPILVVPSDQDCIDEMLRETNCGVSCTSVAEIAGWLGTAYQQWKRTGAIKYEPRADRVARYSYRSQAGELAKLFDDVLAKGRS